MHDWFIPCSVIQYIINIQIYSNYSPKLVWPTNTQWCSYLAHLILKSNSSLREWAFNSRHDFWVSYKKDASQQSDSNLTKYLNTFYPGIHGLRFWDVGLHRCSPLRFKLNIWFNEHKCVQDKHECSVLNLICTKLAISTWLRQTKTEFMKCNFDKGNWPSMMPNTVPFPYLFQSSHSGLINSA